MGIIKFLRNENDFLMAQFKSKMTANHDQLRFIYVHGFRGQYGHAINRKSADGSSMVY